MNGFDYLFFYPCDPSQCQDPNCSNGLKPVKIGCNCCETCIKAKDESKHCFYIPPGIPLPPLPESEMCPNGFYCDRSTRTCKSKKN
ncbi:hypothetical protein HNY73_013110 [Argiope bruennichi]|uniref:IGFBP N-terminal domain-containing protein n=1 Tax=Argiope bruennichi TaxID=94029 RepID=A0A8T0EWZ7_ARGBR|nr:hypothetical protein HNY73_013110 [Argiope bruennichi]